MKTKIVAGKIENLKTSGAVILLFEDGTAGKAALRLDRAIGGMIARLVKQGDF